MSYWCFDNYDNIREDLISIGYDRDYINNQPLWKLRDLYNMEYLGKQYYMQENNIMKKSVEASNNNNTIIDTSIPLGRFTDEQIAALPSEFCVMTRILESNYDFVYKLAILKKKDFIKNPNKCFWINSYWHYALARDIYLVTPEKLQFYKEEKLAELEDQKNKLLETIQEYNHYIVE